MHFDLLEIAYKLTVFFVPFLFSLCFHEYAHGWVAKLRGDRTAEMMGRLTMNPLAHIDWIGTVLLPIASVLFSSPIAFGWAKPVPVNSRNFRNPRTDIFWVALAGPLSNIFLAFCGAGTMFLVARFLLSYDISRAMFGLLKDFVVINLFLAFFNLIPIHPLDGGKIIARFLPARINDMLERHEAMLSLILFFLLMSGAMRVLAYPVQWAYEFLIHLALGSYL